MPDAKLIELGAKFPVVGQVLPDGVGTLIAPKWVLTTSFAATLIPKGMGVVRFEGKEYGEDYVVEPLARQMLRENPALERDFRARVAADTAFARSPQARVDFFFRRTPWSDAEQNLLPVARALRPPPAAVLARQ